MDNWAELWDTVQLLHPGSPLPPKDLEIQLNNFEDKLLNLFENKGPDAGKRQEVRSGKVQTPNMELTLDYDARTKLVPELSDMLQLDEHTCAELLKTVLDKFGTYLPEAACGVYMSERSLGARTLCRLLLLQLFNQLDVKISQDAMGADASGAFNSIRECLEGDPLLGVVVRNNEALLGVEAGSSNKLVSRIVAVVKDHSIDTRGYDVVWTNPSERTTREALLMEERADLCRALLYAVVLSPRQLKASSLVDILSLLEQLVGKVKAAGQAAPHLLVQQASSVLLAAVAALSLLNVAGGTDAAPAAMADLLRSPELKEQLDKLAKPDSGFSAVLCLTWALTKDAIASSSSNSRGAAGGQQQLGGALGGPGFDGTTPGPTSTALLEVAGKARALGTLSAVLSNVAFQLEAEEEHKHLCARIVYGLVTDALQFDANNHRELTQRLLEVSSQHNKEHASSSRGGTWAPPGIEQDLSAFAFPTAPPAAAAPGTAGALAVAGTGTTGTFFAGQQHPQLPVVAQHDDLSSLLEALAAVYRVRPGLWHDREAPAAFPYVTTFMSHLVVHPAVSQLPDVMVSILGVMMALAGGPKGSRFILMQFRQNVAQEKLQGFTWARLFGSIITYCQRYDVLERQAAARGDIANQQPGLLAAKAASLMAPGDAMLLVAYLDLLTAVIASGEAEEVRSSLQGLERDLAPVTGGGPISEPLFQLMCHGVPTRVKAAVDRCLIAMGRFKEVAPHLLQRLVAAAVVNAGSTPMEYSGYNPYDLLLQFNEAEARQEDFSETLAFLDLVNALLTTLGPTGLPEGAIGIAHYTHFVLQHVVAHLWARNYRDPAQKWQLAAAVFRHCQLVLDALATWPENLGTQYMLSRPPPGLSVLVALMSSSQLERALLTHVLGAGHTALEASMESGTEGPHRLAAVLAGFKLLNTALGYDAGAATAINSATTRERVTPLHLQLAHPKGRLPVLLQYVLYYNMDLQYEAIRLLSQLAARLPDMVHLLQPHMDDTAAIIIRQGFALAFELALLDPSAGESVSAGLSAARDADEADGEAATTPSSDSRADLLLDVMIGTLCTEGDPPSLAHLLLGFDVSSIPTEWWQTELHPEYDLSCLSVVLRALQEPDLHLRKPALFAKCLQLLYCIAEPPLTCELVFSLLQPSNEAYGQLLPHLGSLLVEGVPGATGLGQGSSEADVHQQVAALRQRAALLQIYSLALLRYKLPSMLEPLLAVLVGPGSGAAATAAGAAGYTTNGASAALHPYASASGTAALLALQHVCGVALPQQGIEIPAELQQIQQEMSVDDISVAALLSQPSVMESAGVVTTDEYGQPVFDFAVLRRLLHERYEDYVSKTGGRGSPSEAAASQAVAAAFSHAAALNAHALVAGAQSFAVKAWVQTASIAFTKTYALINRSTAPGCGPELLHSTLLGTLHLVAGLSSRGQMGLAAELAGCCRVLMSKLQELAAASLSLGLPGDPLSQVRLPVRCEALLRVLLECLRGASSKYQRGGWDGSSNALRAEMYVCLIQYMHFCRGSKLGDCPPLVLSCLLSGAGPGTSAAQLDALQQQLEEVNGRLLRSCATELVGLMLPDILQPPHRGGMAQAVALHLLATLLSADKFSTALAEVCYREKVPKALLDSVVTHAEGVVMQHSSKAQGALQVLEGQLFLLLSLTMAGGPMAQKASSKAVADAGVLPALARCKALNYLPEGPSDAMRQNKAGTRRYRLVRLVCPVLRLVLSLLGGAPGSAKMVSEALEFCRGQHKLLGRLLKEAAAPASPSWTPGDEELEQAALAVSLLARLPGALRSRDALLAAGAGAAAMQASSLSGLRDDMWQLWQALAGHDKSEAAASGILVMMSHDSTAAGGSSRMQLERRRSLLLQLRVGLAACLRDLVKPAAGAGAAAGGGGGGVGPGVLGPGASELLQLVGPDNHMTMDVLGRPTLLQVHNTAEQAIGDVRCLAQDMESLLAFLARPEAGIVPEDVSSVLSHWGPSLAALSGKPEAAGAAAGGSGNSGMASALVVAGQDGQQSQALVVSGAAGSFGGLDPAAARRLARQCAAKGGSVLLGQLSKQLSLIEQCLVIVLLHLVQCLPRPDSSAVLDAADDMQLDTADGSVEDALLPNPGPEMAAVLGDANALRFFAARMRNVCGQAAGMGCEVRKVLGGGGVHGSAAAAAVGTRQWLDSVDAIDLLTRRLNAYLADR